MSQHGGIKNFKGMVSRLGANVSYNVIPFDSIVYGEIESEILRFADNFLKKEYRSVV